jgi:hypothetical protein
MSEEIVEAAFRFSQQHSMPLMLIASRNQIDWDGGYVNGWTTAKYGAYIVSMKKKYPKARVAVCRDHCGPGFKSDDIADVYKTIDADLTAGFDLIHIDFCHFDGTREDMLTEAKKAVAYVRAESRTTLLEVGTDENTGALLSDTRRIEEEMRFFVADGPVHFFVVQTGTLIKEIEQAGQFNAAFMRKVHPIAVRHGVNIKEHNADYISASEIRKRRGLVDAVNVAPQYGVMQTQLTLTRALAYGLDIKPFLNEAYKSGKWKKWLHKTAPTNMFLCSLIAGHYVFAGDAYKRLRHEIERREDFRGMLMEEMSRNFDTYLSNM